MAYGLSYMPNMGNTGAGWEKLGEVLGQAFQQHGQAKGMAGKYRSLIKAQMGKDEQAQQFSDDFLGSDGTYVVDPDHLGLGELQEVMDAMAARRTDDGRNMMQSVIGGINRAKAENKAAIANMIPENLPGFKKSQEESQRLVEISRQLENPIPLQQEKEQLQGEISSYRARSKGGQEGWQSDSLRLHIPPGTIADSNSAAQEERSFREAELRLSEIDSVLQLNPKEINQRIADAAMERERMVRDLDIKRQGVANQQLNIPDIVMSSMGNHPYASSGAIKEAMNLAGLMQQQQEMEATRPARREMQQAQVSQAQTGAEQAKENLDLSQKTKDAKVRSAETAADYSKKSLEKLEGELESAQKSFSSAELDTIVKDGPKALAGMNKSKRSEAMKIVQLQVNTENMKVQRELANIKKNIPVASGLTATQGRLVWSLIDNASKRMDSLEMQIENARHMSEKYPNSPLVKNLPALEAELKKHKAEVKGYQDILKKELSGLSEGGGTPKRVMQNGVEYESVNGNWIKVK